MLGDNLALNLALERFAISLSGSYKTRFRWFTGPGKS